MKNFCAISADKKADEVTNEYYFAKKLLHNVKNVNNFFVLNFAISVNIREQSLYMQVTGNCYTFWL